MKLLDDYFALQKQIYEYFGYTEDWVVIPIEDARECFWVLDKNEDSVYFSEDINQLIKNGSEGNFYQNEIYHQRFLKKWIYRGADYTMIVVDTHTDGNKFLQVFSNDKELPEFPEELSEW